MAGFDTAIRRPAQRSLAFGLDGAVGLVVPVALAVGWEAGAVLGIIPTRLLPPPSQIGRTLVDLAVKGDLAGHVSALDAFTRLDLQEHVLELWRWDKPTLVLVTHDIDEALALADRVVVMAGQPGRIAATVTVDLARPRLRAHARFHELRDAVLSAARPRAPAIGRAPLPQTIPAAALANGL